MLLLVLIAAVFAAIFMMRSGNKKDDNLLIGYSTDASVMLDQEALQAAMDAALDNAAKGNVGLKYINDAHSTDGINFDCLIANSEGNIHDVYFQIFADAEMKDEIFLSGLVPPGSGFESITLEHALDPGQTTVYVAVTLVDTSESGAQTIINQVIHTMDFYVDT